MIDWRIGGYHAIMQAVKKHCRASRFSKTTQTAISINQSSRETIVGQSVACPADWLTDWLKVRTVWIILNHCILYVNRLISRYDRYCRYSYWNRCCSRCRDCCRYPQVAMRSPRTIRYLSRFKAVGRRVRWTTGGRLRRLVVAAAVHMLLFLLLLLLLSYSFLPQQHKLVNKWAEKQFFFEHLYVFLYRVIEVTITTNWQHLSQ